MIWSTRAKTNRKSPGDVVPLRPSASWAVAVSPPEEWVELNGNRPATYVDRSLVRRIDGEILKGVSFYRTHSILNSLGLRTPTDREYCHAVQRDTSLAEQMRHHLVRTGLLRDIQANADGFTAMYLPTPEVRRTAAGFEIAGAMVRIQLPPEGWFRIDELFESETLLPQRTYERIPSGRYGHFWIREGAERPILRGGWSWSPNEDRCYDVHANWDRPYSSADVAILAAASRRPDNRLCSIASLW